MTLIFASPQPATEGHFVIAWLDRLSDDAISLRICNPGMFRTSVEDGALDGKIVEREGRPFKVRLVATERLYDLLRSPRGPEFFTKSNDAPFRLVSKLSGG